MKTSIKVSVAVTNEACFGEVQLNDTLLICDRDKSNLTALQNRNRTLVTNVS